MVTGRGQRLAAPLAALVVVAGLFLVPLSRPASAAGVAGYELLAAHSGKALDVAGAAGNDGAGVIQWPVNGQTNQRWVPLPFGDAFVFVNANSYKVLDVAGGSTQDGAPIIQWGWNGGANQLWRLTPVGSDHAVFINANSGKALDVAGASTADGAGAIQWTWNGAANQLWKGVAVGGPATTPGPTYLRGIDVSNWQGAVDWPAVKASGRVFAFAKASEGVDYVDPTMAQNRRGMAAAGLTLRGLYHYAHPGLNTPAQEAQHFLSTVGPLAGGEVPVLDLEVEGGPDVGSWAAQWLGAVQQATGRRPLLYSNAYYLSNTATASLTQYPLWVATWGVNDGTVPASPPDIGRWDHWTFWQYTSKASVPGVTGQCDASLFAGSMADLAALG